MIGKTYPVMDFSIHGKHDGESCNFVLHCVHKLHITVASASCIIAKRNESVVNTLTLV